MERGYSHFTIIDEEASGTGQLVYRPGLTQADYKPERGLVVKFFSARPKGMFSFDARTLQRIMSAKLNLNQ